MKLKLILGLALIFIGGLTGCAKQPPTLPLIEGTIYTGTTTNAWHGRTFQEICTLAHIQSIILLENRATRFNHAADGGYKSFFDWLAQSDKKAGADYLAANEMAEAQFAVLTKSGQIFHLQAYGLDGFFVSGISVASNGVSARINVGQFPLATNQVASVSGSLSSLLETDYCSTNPGDWNGKRFDQIIDAGRLKKIFLIMEDMTVWDKFVAPWEQHEKLANQYQFDRRLSPPPAIETAIRRQEHQIGYGKLFQDFGISTQKAEAIHLDGNETSLAKLILVNDAGEVFYLEFIGKVENHISGVLIHGSGKGVRISLRLFPTESVAK